MEIPRQNTYLVCAIAAGLVSLPMVWMSMWRSSLLSNELGPFFEQPSSPTVLFHATPLNSQVWFFGLLPLWFVVAAAIAASGLQLLSRWPAFSVPRKLQWTLAVLAGLWVGLAFVYGIVYEKGSPHLGLALGSICAGMPLICLWHSRPKRMR